MVPVLPQIDLPSDFQFSQSSLQDYVDCPQRFRLRYLLGLAWPGVEVEPAMAQETHLRQGDAFHRLVYQHLLGVPLTHLARSVAALRTDGYDDIDAWWQNYLAAMPGAIEGTRFPEVSLYAPIAGYQLVAQYDMVVVTPDGRALILDWKTSRRRPSSSTLVARLQTRVYRCLLVTAGATLNRGRALAPEQVEMVYWFAGFPDAPERLPYDETQYQADRRYLENLILEIKHLDSAGFPATGETRRCAACVYRSFCERGVQAGGLAALDDLLDSDRELDLDFEQIAEIAY